MLSQKTRKRLQQARKNRGYTQTQAANALTISRVWLAKIEAGSINELRNSPSLDLLQRMAKVYNVQMAYLIDEENTPDG